MKLSIIVPIYKNSDSVREFLTGIKEQENKNYELILIADTNAENILQIIDEFKTLKKRIKLIYNSMRQGRTSALKMGVDMATGDYAIIMSTSNIFKSTFVVDALSAIESRGTDVIEFKAVFKEPKKFDGRIRKTFNTPTNLEDHPEIIAYSYPFDFNKMFKLDVIRKAFKDDASIYVNSRFSVTHLYRALLEAKTYSTIAKELIISRSKISDNFNPLTLIKQWKDIIKNADIRYERKYHAELMYARYFYEIVFLFGFVGISKNKILLDKLNKNFQRSLKTDFIDFTIKNQYVLTVNKETELIKQFNTSAKLTKVFKNL